MDIDIFTLCDFAQDVQGKITIVGTFDTIWAHEFPAIQPTCSIVARIRYSIKEAGQHSFKISILSDSGKEIPPPLSGKLDLKIPSDQEWGTANIVIGIGLLKLPSYGRYSVNLLLDDKQIKSLHFYVKKMA
jgi:hypothetical protein